MAAKRRGRLVAVAVAATVLLGVGATTVAALGARLPDPIPAAIAQGDVTVGLETVASGFISPVTGTYSADDNKTLYVGEQTGKIWAVDVARSGKAPKERRLVADLSSLLVPLGCFGINYDERGLFGIAFHPDFRHNGTIYTFHSEKGAGRGDCNPQDTDGVPNHFNVVTEWRMTNFKDHGAATVDPTTRREVLRVAHPQFNHNGGELRFGPDGMLYVSFGDGGNADDQGTGHAPQGNAQDLSSLLGKVLRINPNTGSATPGYSVPPDNPYVGRPGARAEIFANGFRNPYKMSFDEAGRLIVADVGQNDVEEVDVVTAGGNYGWPVKEGSFAFNQNGSAVGFVTADPVAGPYIDPIAQYDHCIGPVAPDLVGPCPKKEGIAIVGGFFYPHDGRIKALRGKYVFADYSQDFFTSAGRLLYLDGPTVKELKLTTGKPLGMGVLGIGQDERGEVYVLAKSGAKAGNTGVVDPTNTSGLVMRLVETTS